MNILQKYPFALAITLSLVLIDIGSSLVMAYTIAEAAQTTYYDNSHEYCYEQTHPCHPVGLFM
ncbi:hypothetical protein [Thiothrix lacustris]|uniref:hypothetical protein n=1 Tax=Thiothrix lacustris TaxID=525917 RepID=UPI0027E41C61|nr:hypothetical protein [Thiothrix lacustris]WMP16314.1 hypothetical protein RCS87_13065 [Thiothrix lacustris]